MRRPAKVVQAHHGRSLRQSGEAAHKIGDSVERIGAGPGAPRASAKGQPAWLRRSWWGDVFHMTLRTWSGWCGRQSGRVVRVQNSTKTLRFDFWKSLDHP